MLSALRIRPCRKPARMDTVPRTAGRCVVRCITESISRSYKLLKLFAAPAANAPPVSTATVACHVGNPSAARNIVGTAVTRRSSMIRGLVSAMCARIWDPIEPRTRVEPTESAIATGLSFGFGSCGSGGRDRGREGSAGA